ncbi:SEC-C metal-binding domain-containing protein [Gracilibacillus lacisalsi]|uniref:SEC-C metal-binding domain-containing protein n=1 Tax=Gracilibacillus lacisalsi TaxID=393087 RepID=UPI0003791C75|nr:SEC-C metal-binding domain-containing protein [Gracilibacillus lacisalsi]
MVNYRLQAQLLGVVDNQLRENNPKCTKTAFNLLIDLGYTEDEAKKMIAAILVEEMFDVMKNEKEFNEKRYCKKLDKLPEYYLQKYAETESDEEIQVPVVNEQKIGRNDPCPYGSGKKFKKCCG